jgi:hypothetical protein
MPDPFHQPLIERRAADMNAFIQWRLGLT